GDPTQQHRQVEKASAYSLHHVCPAGEKQVSGPPNAGTLLRGSSVTLFYLSITFNQGSRLTSQISLKHCRIGILPGVGDSRSMQAQGCKSNREKITTNS